MNTSLKKVFAPIIIIVLAAVMLAACGKAAEPAPTPTPSPTPTPVPTPTPSPEPILFPHELITVDGHELESGSFTDESGIIYASFSEVAEALELELSQAEDSISFIW